MRVLAVLLVALAFNSSAFAADMAFKASPPPVAPAYGWTGFYMGAQGGYEWSNLTFTYGPGFSSAGVPARGGFVGFTGGYNWQNGPWVFGIEADISDANVSGSVLTANTAPCYVEGCTAKLSSFGTGRLRLGYATGAFLPYITGGGAVGAIRGSADLGACNYVGVCGFNEIRGGWTAGGGLEWKFSANWSAKVEYLYMDFGSPSFTSGVTSSDFVANILRGGVNLRFY